MILAFTILMSVLMAAAAIRAGLNPVPLTVRSSAQKGSLFFALFGAVAMVGVLGAGMNMVMRGPVTTMSEVTRRTVAENNMIASTRLAIVMSPTSQANGGDCDGDGYVEPIPYRDAGAGPKPAGGGYVPSTIGASMTDPWQTQYGYCVWDHGAQTVSNNVAACGGTTARRLNGAPLQTQIAVAVISAGKDRTFQTACNAFVDANVDGTPDTPLLNRPGGSDDIILGYTYAEANNMGNNLWALKSGDTGTAQIGKNIEVSGDANVAGRLRLSGGLVLPGDPGNNSITGACNTANDQALRRNTSTSPPVLEICDFAGGQTTWKPVGGAAAAADNLGNHTATQNLDMATFKVINAAIPTNSADLTNKAYVDAAVASAAGGTSGRFQVSCGVTYDSYRAMTCVLIDTQTAQTACQTTTQSYNSATPWESCGAGTPNFSSLSGGGISTGSGGGGALYAQNAFGWGNNSYGGLGDNSTGNKSTPSKINLNLAFTTIAAGVQTTCGIASGKPYCWGYGSNGEMGNGTTTATNSSPTSVDISAMGYPTVSNIGFSSPAMGFLKVSGGYWYSWGSPDGSYPVQGVSGGTAPNLVYWYNSSNSYTALPVNIEEIELGQYYGCARRSTGAIYCAIPYSGGGYQCSRGNGSSSTGNQCTNSNAYQQYFHEAYPVTGGNIYTDLAVGVYHACAVTNTGTIRCWGGGGNSNYGVIGNNTQMYWDSPQNVSVSHISPAPVFTKVYSNFVASHTCALTDAGKAYCWGYNASGQLGTGDTSNRRRPEPVLGAYNFAQLAVGGNHTCGLTTDGTVYCWGYGGNGQLGYGSTGNKLIPEPVTSGSGYVGIAAGNQSSFGWK